MADALATVLPVLAVCILCRVCSLADALCTVLPVLVTCSSSFCERSPPLLIGTSSAAAAAAVAAAAADVAVVCRGPAQERHLIPLLERIRVVLL
jgi:hypothetical protein